MSRTQISIIAIVLLGLTGYVGLLLFANLNAVGSQGAVKTWQQKNVVPDEEGLQKTLEDIQEAIKFDPANPEYLAAEAQLFRYRALMFEPLTSESEAANREALEKYLHLLSLRPSWAPYWASIVGIKYELWEYDELMITALQNTARLAPWFEASQRIILQAGFHGWPFIDAETREVVNQTLERAMQLQPKETISMAFSQRFSDRVVPYIEGDEVLEGFYEKEVKKGEKKVKGGKGERGKGGKGERGRKDK